MGAGGRAFRAIDSSGIAAVAGMAGVAGGAVARYVDVGAGCRTGLSLFDRRPVSACSGVVTPVTAAFGRPMVTHMAMGTMTPRLSDERRAGGAMAPIKAVSPCYHQFGQP